MFCFARDESTVLKELLGTSEKVSCSMKQHSSLKGGMDYEKLNVESGMIHVDSELFPEPGIKTV